MESWSIPDLFNGNGKIGKGGIFGKQPVCIVTFFFIDRWGKEEERSEDPTIAEYRSNWRKVGRSGGIGSRRSNGDGDPLNGNRTKAKRIGER